MLEYDGEEFILNGERGHYLTEASRTVHIFRDQDLILKIEHADYEQTVSDAEFRDIILQPSDERYFAPILSYGELNSDCAGWAIEDDWPSWYLIQPYYDYIHTEDAKCEHWIVANRLANKYAIKDWHDEQWGIVDDQPLIWDVGFGSQSPEAEIDPSLQEFLRGRRHCGHCYNDHNESLEW